MTKPDLKTEISIKDVSGKIVLKFTSAEALSHDELLQKAVVHAAENRIPLRGADLRGIKLNHADLTGLILDGARLSGAVIRASSLDGISCVNANLDKIKIINTSMKGALLNGTKLNNAVLYRANLQYASLISTSFFGAQIRQSNFYEAHAHAGIISFEGAFIQNSDFRKTDFSNLYFSRASINRTDFTDAALHHGQMQSTRFNMVNFTDTQLSFLHGQATEFVNCNINHALVENCHLTKFRINDKQYGNLAILPQVIRSLQQNGYSFVSEPEPKSDLMLMAILDKDQQAIDRLIREHRLISTDHSLFDMQGIQLKGKDLSGLKFNHTDFSGADFSGADLSNTEMLGSVLDGAFIFNNETCICNGLKLINCSVRNVFFHDISLHNGVITESDLSYSKFHSVKANDINMSNSLMYGTQFEDRTFLNNADFDESILNNVYANNTVIKGHFRLSELTNCHFTFCDMSGSIFDQAEFRNLNFISSDLSGIKLIDTEPNYLHFEKTDLSGAELVNLKILNSEFIETDLSHADIHGSFFKKTRLCNVHLLNTNAQDTIFIDSEIVSSDIAEVLAPTQSMHEAAGLKMESQVCVGDAAKLHLDKLRELINYRTPESENDPSPGSSLDI